MKKVLTGLENLLADPRKWLFGQRIGLLCNPASVDGKLRHAKDLLSSVYGKRLSALFSPQHGLHAEKQDNMIESDNFIDTELEIPVFSLYGKTRIPTDSMLSGIDVMIIDIQDVGSRVYTFFSTVSYCMEAAARLGKKIVVLDRPNPIGGIAVEGNRLAPEFKSFVGRFLMPMRHGLTIGEFASYINTSYTINCDLCVIPMKGWQRKMYHQDTGLFWVPPSPNLPTPTSAMVYPGQVLLEGTNISEGRGTTQPFEIFGAPFIDNARILELLGDKRIAGAVLRPVVFEPVAGKWANTPCHGFQIHVTDPAAFIPYRTSIQILAAIYLTSDGRFEWKSPPYEYEWEKPPIDLISGDPLIRELIEANRIPDEEDFFWQEDENRFAEETRPFLLYRK
ncbi:MAG: DUF1343 domain-containing protein [Deltaproteobacteria bacterium]|nr:DUF1343 domain-containing protein [Deltaproteobacteria bacterium]